MAADDPLSGSSTGSPRTSGATSDTEPTHDTLAAPGSELFSHHATDLGLREAITSQGDIDIAPGASLGDIRIVGLVAEGGMGRVYEGWQTWPNRRVAVKVMRSTRMAPEAIERFRREIEVLARLVHPGIAQVHLAGACRVADIDIPYYVMEFVEGSRTILQHCAAASLDTIDRCRLLVNVCDAIAHGHARGVVHRDIKPGNVLVDPEGRPKVIDFGIARVSDESEAGRTDGREGLPQASLPTDESVGDVSSTRTGTLLGTRRCMSPEQFAADGRPVSPASDVYALGVLMHELLTGSPPHDLDGLPLPLAARTVLETPPRPLVLRDSSLNAGTARRLASIADRCLAKAPADRFATAADVAEALRAAVVHPSRVRRAPWAILASRRAVTVASIAVLAMTVLAVAAGRFTRVVRPGGAANSGGAAPLNFSFSNVAAGRVDPLGWLSITFDREVDKLEIASFRLTHDGVEIPLEGVTTAGSGRHWRIEGLAPLTGRGGFYQLISRGGDRGPLAADGGRVAVPVAVTWRMPDRLEFSFDVTDADWRSHVVSISGLETYTERHAGSETFIRPTKAGREGSIVLRFESSFQIQDATLFARLAVWTTGDPFPYDPGARAALDVSRNGTEWVTIATLEAGSGGFAGGPFDIASTVAGGTDVWIRARLTGTREWPDDGLIYSQFLRSDARADRPAFGLVLVGRHPPLIPTK